MRRDRVNYFVVGLFVLIIGVVFLALLYRLTGSSGPTDRYHVYYDNVGGLKYGTGIFYEGFQVGQIESITPERRGGATHYKVEFSVVRGWQIPDDSVASVIASGLLAAMSIDIREGKSAKVLAPGSEIKGAGQVNLFATLNDVARDFHDLSVAGIQPVLKNLNERIGALTEEYRDLSRSDVRPLIESLRRRVDDPQLFDQLKGVLKRLDDSAGRLQKLLGEENQRLVTSTLGNVEHASLNMLDLLNRIEATRLQMHHVAGELDRLVTDNRDNVTKTLANTASSSDDLRASMLDLRKSLRIISDNIDTIMYHLEGAGRNMHEFSREIRENPGLLLNGSPQQDQAQGGKQQTGGGNP